MLDGGRILYDFNPDTGLPVYKEQAEIESPLSERLNKLFNERPFLTLTEDNLGQTDNVATTEKQDKVQNQTFTEEEVAILKTEMMGEFSIAGTELMKALDLINYLVPAQSGPDIPAPELPMGQYALGVSVLSTPLPFATLEASTYDASLAVAKKSTAISNASAALLNAADRLNKTAVQSKSDWEHYCNWQDEGWTLAARGAGRGASLAIGNGAEMVAKELVATLACSEAPAGVKFNNVAYLKTANGENSVATSERMHGRRRLHVELTINGSTHVYIPDGSTQDLLLQSQAELFEEEAYDEMIKEFQLQSKLDDRPFRGEVSKDALYIELADDASLRLSMETTDSTSQIAQDSGKNYARLVSAALRLRLLSLYTWRRSTDSTLSKQPPILRPVVDLMAYALHVRWLQDVLSTLTQDANATVDFTSVDRKISDIVGSLNDPQSTFSDIGGHAILRFNDAAPLRIVFSLPQYTAIDLPHNRVSLSSKIQIQEVLKAEMERIRRTKGRTKS